MTMCVIIDKKQLCRIKKKTFLYLHCISLIRKKLWDKEKSTLGKKFMSFHFYISLILNLFSFCLIFVFCCECLFSCWKAVTQYLPYHWKINSFRLLRKSEVKNVIPAWNSRSDSLLPEKPLSKYLIFVWIGKKRDFFHKN